MIEQYPRASPFCVSIDAYLYSLLSLHRSPISSSYHSAFVLRTSSINLIMIQRDIMTDLLQPPQESVILRYSPSSGHTVSTHNTASGTTKPTSPSLLFALSIPLGFFAHRSRTLFNRGASSIFRIRSKRYCVPLKAASRDHLGNSLQPQTRHIDRY